MPNGERSPGRDWGALARAQAKLEEEIDERDDVAHDQRVSDAVKAKEAADVEPAKEELLRVIEENGLVQQSDEPPPNPAD